MRFRFWDQGVVTMGLLLLVMRSAALGASSPSITTQPQSQTVISPSNAVFTVVASGQTPLFYQWSFAGTNLTNNAHISGATNSTLTVSNVTASDAGGYRVVVSNSHGTDTSSVASLTVLYRPTISAISDQRTFPALSTHPIPFTIDHAGSPVITATAANPTLINPNGIGVSGSGTNYTITIQPSVSNLVGTTTITIAVTNLSNGLGSTRSFQLKIADFSEVVSNLPGAYYGSVCWVDYDNDGRLDLFLCGVDTNYLGHTWLFHNDGAAGFSEVPTPFANLMYSSADWGDFNNDGLPDLVLQGQISWATVVIVYRNDGNGQFTQMPGNYGGFNPGCVRWGDFNNDGRLDILVTEPSFTSICSNNGDGTFTQRSMNMLGAGRNTSAWVDFDGDGQQDVFVMGGTDATYWGGKLYRNAGDGNFTNQPALITGFVNGAIVWGDFNNDGLPDLITTGDYNSYPTSQIYTNSAGTLTNAPNSLAGFSNGAGAAGDYNNDGNLDLFLAGGSDGVGSQVVQGWGGLLFGSTTFAVPAMINGSAMWGDYDNDGGLDLVCMGQVFGTPTTKLYHNEGAMPDTAPTAPAGLTVAYGYNSVTLSWNAATDAEQSGGLTYNVRVGANSSGVNVLSPLADLVTGFRRVPKIGNAAYRTNLVIKGLPAGTYYWSVQSIDHAYKGSTFAGEQSFSIPAPIITIQPTNTTVFAGNPASLSVTATGAATLGYQWQFNGTNILGANASTFTIAAAQLTNQGVYSVLVTNAFGSVLSSNAFLTVQTPPSVTQSPQSTTNVVGSWAMFSGTATGSLPLAYQWYFNGVALTNGGTAFGVDSNVLTLPSVLTNETGTYWLVVTNDFGAATSAVVSLTVSAPDVLLNVDFGNGAQSLKSGPTAIGRSATDFWNLYKLGAGGVTNILMAEGTPSAVRVSVTGMGPVVLTNSNPDPMYNGTFYQYNLPGNLTVDTTNLPAGTYDFYYYAGCGDYNYQLLVNGATVAQHQVWGSGSTSTNWQEGVHYAAFRGVTLTNSTSLVRVVITYLDSVCLEAVISGMQIAETFPGPTAPVFFAQPRDVTIPSGFNALFTAAAAGAPAPLNYQWIFNGVPLANDSRISGANTYSLAISNAQPADNGTYQLVASNSIGVSTSAVAVLTAQSLPPTFTVQPTNVVTAPGSNVVLSALATGSIPIGYQWYLNDLPLTDDGHIAGSGSPTLTISPGQTNDNGRYYVVASNSVNVTTSAVASVFVGVKPSITQQPLNQTNISFTTANFSVAADGTLPLSYRWYFGGAPLSDTTHVHGSTNANLSIYSVGSSDAGNYFVIVTNPAGSVTSVVATLTVHLAPSINTQPIGRSSPLGWSNSLTATAGGDAPLSYQWRLNGVDIPNATNTTYAIPALTTNDLGAYRFVASNAYGFATSVTALVTVCPVGAWGNNSFAQCIAPPGLTNVTTIAAGTDFSLASLLDGSIVGWGSAISKYTNSSWTNIVAVSGSSSGALGLRADGSVVASSGLSYPGLVFAPSNIVAVAAGNGFGIGLREEGTVVGWGSMAPATSYRSADAPPGLNHVKAISAGYGHAMALRTDGTVVAWGNSLVTNVPLGLSNVIAIAAGTTHSLALKSDGTVIAWGTGGGTNVPAGLTNVVTIGANNYFDQRASLGFAVRADGSIICWGVSPYAETNVPTAASNVVAVAGSVYHALVLENDGSPQILQQPVGGTGWLHNNFAFRTVAAGAAPLSYQWRINGTNISGATNPVLSFATLQSTNGGNYQVVVSNAVGVVTSLPAPLVVTAGPVFLLTQPATNFFAYLGNPMTLSAAAQGTGPIYYQWRCNGTNIPGATNDTLTFTRAHLSNNGAYTVVVTNPVNAVTSAVANVTVQQVITWGNNTYGQLGVPNMTNALGISAEYYNDLVLRSDGTVTIWGNAMPTNTVGISNIVEITAGNGTALALRSDSRPFLWGNNVATIVSNSVAARSNIVSVSYSSVGYAFLLPNGTILELSYDGLTLHTNTVSTNAVALTAWYLNNYVVQRADGTLVSANGNLLASNVYSFDAIANGQSGETVALRRDGTVQEYPQPLLTNAANAIGVAASGGSSLDFAVLSDGSLVYNGYGNPATNVPYGINSVQMLDLGSQHGLALLSDRDFPPVFLHTALNTTNYVVSSRGAGQWFGQTNISHDGVSATQSAAIGNNTASSMRLWVYGPTTAKFWWKVSSATNHGVLRFSAGGVSLTNISGEVDWQQASVNIPPGGNILQWTYAKDGATAAGQDTAWVDQLEFTNIPPAIVSQPAPATQTVIGGTNVLAAITLSMSGTPPFSYGWIKDGAPFVIHTNGFVETLAFPSVTRSNSGTYYVVVTNTAGAVTSSNAMLAVHVPQLLGAPVLLPDGTLGFSATDADGALVSSDLLTNLQLQMSTNLLDWATLSNALSYSNGTVNVQDNATNAPQKFYRLIESW